MVQRTMNQMATINNTRDSHMYANIDSKLAIKFIEGWLEHRSSDNNWRRYWCVLRNDVIYLFNSNKETKESYGGKIALSQHSKLVKLDGAGDQGYKFNLYTKRSLNSFKAAKFTERELWKAYVEGITLGEVSDDIDLLPGQIEEVRILLKQFLSKGQHNSTYFDDSESPTSNLKDDFDTPNSSTSGSFYQDDDYLVPIQNRVSSIDISQRQRFYPDPTRHEIPSWFFSECSRELSMQILKVGARYGNTLMRENTSDKNKFVISKRMEIGSSGQDFSHYILERTSRGYKIDVENPHEPMKTLSEVMEFFVTTSGNTTTRPMTCNDLKVLGIEQSEYTDYNKKIETILQDADSGEESPLDIIAPPVPHLQKIVKPHNTVGPHGSWNVRSMSVPNISPQELEQVQTARASKLAPVSSLSKGSHNSHIMRTVIMEKQEGSFQPTYMPDKKSAATQPSVLLKSPVPSTVIPPPLPPNHPPPLKKAHSQSGMIIPSDNSSGSVKKMGPKHTQSFSSADIQVRKIPATKSPEPTISSELENEDTKYSKEIFKKTLEGLLKDQGPRLRTRTATTEFTNNYAEIAHYQNANEIQNVRK